MQDIKLYIERTDLPEEDNRKYGSMMISQLQIDSILHAVLNNGIVSFPAPHLKNLTPIGLKKINQNGTQYLLKVIRS